MQTEKLPTLAEEKMVLSHSFRELLERHIGLVYSVAFRQLDGDHSAAQDVSQSVFVDLWKKSGHLESVGYLPAWLHQHAIFASRNWIRSEQRRRLREQKAMELQTTSDDVEFFSDENRGILDGALCRLSTQEREGLLLRFYHPEGNLGQDLRLRRRALGDPGSKRPRFHPVGI